MPIFIVGSSRSGTSLMLEIINRMSSHKIALETHYFDDLRPRLGDPCCRLSDDEKIKVENYFLAISHRPYGVKGDPEKSPVGREKLRNLAEELGGSGDAYFEAHCRLHRLDDRIEVVDAWGEKTPRHVCRIKEIAEAFPKSRFIFMLRDPRAVVFSYAKWSKKHHEIVEATEDHELRKLRRQEAERMRRSFHPVIATMVWKSAVSTSLNARNVLGDHRFKIVRYESLCESEDETIEDLWNWIDTKEVDHDATVPFTNSSFEEGENETGLSQKSVNRWKEHMLPRTRRRIERLGGRTLDKVGYPRKRYFTDPLMRPFDYLAGVPAFFSAVIVNRSRYANPVQYIGRRLMALISP